MSGGGSGVLTRPCVLLFSISCLRFHCCCMSFFPSTKRCGDGVRQSMSQGFQIEKFKIALGLFQVFSSFKMTVSTAMAVVAATKTIVSYVCSMCFLVTEFFFFSFSVVSLYHSTKSIGHRK